MEPHPGRAYLEWNHKEGLMQHFRGGGKGCCVFVFVREKETHTHREGERQKEERRYVVFLFL